MAAKILIYGKDRLLLETRQRLLRYVGFECIAVRDFGQVIDLVQQDGLALLVLCSSLSALESGAVLSAVDQLGKTQLRKLVLSTEPQNVEASDTIRTFQTPLAPQAFLSLVGAAVGQS